MLQRRWQTFLGQIYFKDCVLRLRFAFLRNRVLQKKCFLISGIRFTFFTSPAAPVCTSACPASTATSSFYLMLMQEMYSSLARSILNCFPRHGTLKSMCITRFYFFLKTLGPQQPWYRNPRTIYNFNQISLIISSLCTSLSHLFHLRKIVFCSFEVV